VSLLLLLTTTGAAPPVPVWSSPADTVSMSATPTLAFTIPALGSAMHFNLQLDTANTFDTGSLRDLMTTTDQTGWEYWNGAAWTAFPAAGVSNTYAGNDARYTVQTTLGSGTWYRRVRAGT
jgi:hypothetical protein